MNEMLDLTQNVVRFGLALLLAISGVTKVTNPTQAAKGIEQYGIVPKRYTRAFGITLPVAELCIALALLFPTTVSSASVGATLLFALFTGAIGVVLVRKQAVDCGCFGAAWQTKISKRTLVRNLAFLLTALLLFLSQWAWMRTAFVSVPVLQYVLARSSFLLMVIGWIFIIWRPQAQPADKPPLVLDPSLSQSIPRRTLLKVAALLGVSSFMSFATTAEAATCCYSRRLEHFDPACCPSAVFHIHHHWKSCYNSCNGKHGQWHNYAADSCDTYDCGCGCAVDTYYPYQASCYYAWECSCCTNCPC